MTDDIKKLLDFGRIGLETGQYEQAREDFEKVLTLDPSNREAMKGLARANEILSRRMPTPVEPTRAEPVQPLRKVSLEPTKPEVEPAKPKSGLKLATMWTGKGYWLALALIPVLLLAFVFAYQRVLPALLLTPTPTPIPTSTPWPTSTPRPLPERHALEVDHCRLTGVDSNEVVTVQPFHVKLAGSNWGATIWLWIKVTNISSRTVHVNPGYLILVDGSGKSLNYGLAGSNRLDATDVYPGTYTYGQVKFFPCEGEPKKLIYDDGWHSPIVLDIILSSCERTQGSYTPRMPKVP